MKNITLIAVTLFACLNSCLAFAQQICQTPYGPCQMLAPYPEGAICTCYTAYGNVAGYVFGPMNTPNSSSNNNDESDEPPQPPIKKKRRKPRNEPECEYPDLC